MTRQMEHLRAMGALVPPAVRLVPWWHLAVGAVLAFTFVWMRWSNPHVSVDAMVTQLQIAMIPMALAAAFVLDDPTLEDTTGIPLPIAARRTARLVLVVPVLGAMWAGLLVFAAAAPALGNAPAVSPGSDELTATLDSVTGTAEGFLLPVWSLTLEMTGLVTFTLAAAVISVRWMSDHNGGLAAGPATLALAGVLAVPPLRGYFYPAYTPAPAADAPVTEAWLAWVAAHQHWALLATVAAAALMWFSRDPARPGLVRSLRRNRHEQSLTEEAGLSAATEVSRSH